LDYEEILRAIEGMSNTVLA